MIDYKNLGSMVKYHRTRNNLSQEDLAEKSDTSRVHIGFLERGERIPSLETIVNVANALHVSADDLLVGSLLVTSPRFNSEEISILADCTVAEREILIDTMRALKDTLRSYQITK